MKSIMILEQEGPLSDDKESSKQLKDKSKLFLIFPKFQKIVLTCDINQCPLNENLNVNMIL